MPVMPTLQLFRAAHTPASESAAVEVLRSGQIASGQAVGQFEAALAHCVGRRHVVATDNMTSALALALRLAGVGPGDEVATLAFSCLSSTAAIAQVGATPAWVDIQPDTASMSVQDLERALSSRTKAVTMYHVAGYPGPAREVAALCRARGIAFIEDCNNALGGLQDGQQVGRHADYAVWSFYPNRHVNGGEGGALACPDDATLQRALRLRRFGIDMARFRGHLGEINPHCDVPEIGWSVAMSNLHAAIALADLPELDQRLLRTRAAAARLRAACAGVPGLQPVSPIDGAIPTYWAFLLRSAHSETFLQALSMLGIKGSRLHHRNDDYSGFNATRRPLPGTEAFMAQVLGVPCGWWLDDTDIDRLCNALVSAATS
jgi:perosamine synthetase